MVKLEENGFFFYIQFRKGTDVRRYTCIQIHTHDSIPFAL